ncbi:MAG: VCBS repeat-containing protein, partial [Candidatus Pacebacteria bacterium]|nr:VCBS repeat-containing protein [Candidatus Paceibacterota bacterium]
MIRKKIILFKYFSLNFWFLTIFSILFFCSFPVYAANTFITSGSDPLPVTVGPGYPVTTINSFTLNTDSGVDVISSLTLTIDNPSVLRNIAITDSSGNTTYGSVSFPTGTTTVISLSGVTVTSATTTYLIRVIPKLHSELSFGVNGGVYKIKAVVLSWSGSNNKIGKDSLSSELEVDNYTDPSFGTFSSTTLFDTRVNYTSNYTNPYFITTADLNNDGRPDLITANTSSTYQNDYVSVHMNNGDGTFATKVNYGVGTGAANPYFITVDDLNGDGKIDIASANYNSANVSVLMNNGDGTFAARINYTAGTNPYFITTADLNNDGRPDLVTSNYGSANVSVHINNGDGTFAARINYNVGTNPYFITVDDLNGDGKIDIASANYNSANVSVLMNNGDGTFAARINYTAGTNPYFITTADLNNDGRPDLVTSNYGSANVSVHINNGDGTFAARINYNVGTNPYFITVDDLNGDGKIDIASANYNSANVSVLMNNGDGTFAARVNYTSNYTNPYFITTADLNNDGRPDLITANTSSTYQNDYVSVHMNNGDGTFATKLNHYVGTGASNPYFITVDDLNGDGKIDIASANYNSANVSVLSNISIFNINITSVGSGYTTLSYVTPINYDLNSILILRSTSPIVNVPVDGVSYSSGDVIGSAVVGCVDSTVIKSTADSCTVNGLISSTTYYFALFVKDNYGNYSIMSQSIPYATTTISLANQSALTVTNTTSTYGSGLTLSSSGGSGGGAVTYALVAAGTANCSVTSGGVVTFTAAGT